MSTGQRSMEVWVDRARKSTIEFIPLPGKPFGVREPDTGSMPV
ncbi:hypothetical protein J2W35_000557 [Variovorax boronicumulans]|nr:hypothetical protein [Variovorax boronicumulans]MDQ0080229.1 hypothetical protein [Variovorax boronicumulans]